MQIFAINRGKKGVRVLPSHCPSHQRSPRHCRQEGWLCSCMDLECPGGSWEPWPPSSPMLGWAPEVRNPVCSELNQTEQQPGPGGAESWVGIGAEVWSHTCQLQRLPGQKQREEGEEERARHSESLLCSRRVWSLGQPGNDWIQPKLRSYPPTHIHTCGHQQQKQLLRKLTWYREWSSLSVWWDSGCQF